MAMLISGDVLKHWQRMIDPPAQLCLIRMIGSDNQFLLRVRCGEAYLDLPLEVPLTTNELVKEHLNLGEIGAKLHAMGQLVVPPGTSPVGNWYPSPQVLTPEKFNANHFYSEEYYGS